MDVEDVLFEKILAKLEGLGGTMGATVILSPMEEVWRMVEEEGGRGREGEAREE